MCGSILGHVFISVCFQAVPSLFREPFRACRDSLFSCCVFSYLLFSVSLLTQEGMASERHESYRTGAVWL